MQVNGSIHFGPMDWSSPHVYVYANKNVSSKLFIHSINEEYVTWSRKVFNDGCIVMRSDASDGRHRNFHSRSKFSRILALHN